MDVANWLRTLDLEQYEATSRENDVNAELLPNLTTDDLSIAWVGRRKRLRPIGRNNGGWIGAD